MAFNRAQVKPPLITTLSWWQTRQFQGNVRHFFTYVFLIVAGAFFAMPFLWMLSTSVKPDTEIFLIPPQWIPSQLIWENYPKAINYIPFFLYMRNTLFITVMASLGILISTPPVAYSFSHIPWPGRNVVFILVLATMMLPYQVTMIPVYIVFKNLGWVGTFYPMWVPAFFSHAFSIFLLRQFFMTIPQELGDAGRIDGASEFTIFLRIILPLSKPALSTIVLFQFMNSWNDFLTPLIYLRQESMYTMSLGLQQFTSLHGLEWSLLMAASLMFAAPIIIIFFLAQSFFIEGISMTGIKG
jgi:multiple sugar transport system permease protein